jgi:CubicO group peptidase (beta-lactamase class C family)
MATPSAVSPRYGLGYELPPPAGAHPILMHGGTNHGWSARFLLAPDLGLGIAVLTNSDGTASLRETLKAFRDALVARLQSER